MAETRIDHLRWLLTFTRDSLLEAPIDKRSPLIAQMRAVLLELAELGADVPAEVERNGLLDFQNALAERQSATKGSRRATRG
jgi:hypothetical protein